MNNMKRFRKSSVATAFAVIAMLLSAQVSKVFGHGGEDHGAEKAPVVSSGAGMLTRTARAGDFEVTVKHPPIEPDKEIAARIFVTRFDSNEPVKEAKITLLFSGGGATVEAMAAAANTPGMYEVKLPPMPQGDYKLAARVEGGGGTQTVEYGAIKVAPAPPAQAENSSSWAHTALIALALLVGLGIVGFLLYRVAQYARRNRSAGETATA